MNRFQFSLRALLLALTAVCVMLARHVSSQKALERQRLAIYGEWQRVNSNGDPVVTSDGHLCTQFWTPSDCSVDPKYDPAHIDIESWEGTLPGIYQWYGESRIHVRCARVGAPRPASFNDGDAIIDQWFQRTSKSR